MSTQKVFTGPVMAVVWSFIGLTVLALALTLAGNLGILDAVFVKRAIGVLIGVTIIVTGNFLPKIRPMNAPGCDPVKATAAERVAGWMLVLSGLAYLALFIFAPLDRARLAAPIIGLAAIVVVAVNWLWLACGSLFGTGRATESAGGHGGWGRQRRELMIWVLFALFYLFAAGNVAFLVDDKAVRNEIAAWMLLAFCLLYFVVFAILDIRRRHRKSF
ncbi:MAG: hypothetical protein ACRES7_04800 [Gammaproteobacteria bacterium]